MDLLMKRAFEMEKIHVYIKFFITFILYYMVKDFASVDSFSKLAVALLEFIIILELVRMLIEFLFSGENRIKLRLMIDSSIVFFMRDVLLIVSDKFDTTKILSLLLVIFILFIFRIIAMKYSPSYMENRVDNKK